MAKTKKKTSDNSSTEKQVKQDFHASVGKSGSKKSTNKC